MFNIGSLFSGRGLDVQLKCFPVAHIGRDELEIGNRVILPPSILEELSRASTPSPMLFEVSDLDRRRRTHVGVLEFNGPEETCYMPMWILKLLCADVGDVLRVTLASLPKAELLSIKPEVGLLRVYNPRALLENGLRNFAALTVGDAFSVEYGGQLYRIEVVGAQPANAVCIVEADVQIEIVLPEPPKREPTPDVRVGEDGESEGNEVDDMPWKKRIPGGVKWKTPPHGFESKQPPPTPIAVPAQPLSYTAVPTRLGGDERDGDGDPAVLKAAALEAAERREADQAEEIAKRRQLEQEEKERRRIEEERLDRIEKKKQAKRREELKAQLGLTPPPTPRGNMFTRFLRRCCRCGRGPDNKSHQGQRRR